MGFFNKFKKGLSKTRRFLSENFTRIAAGLGSFDDEMLDELEMILVSADMGASNAMYLMDKVRDGIKKTGKNDQDFVLSILKEEIVEMLGPKVSYEPVDGKLNILIMAGVNGTGKTTTAGKLALRYKEEGKSVLLAAADTFRAAAIEQLKHWAEKVDVPVIAHQTGSDPAAVVFDAVSAAVSRKVDLLIIDTAGRLHNKKNLMEEFAKIGRIAHRQAPEGDIKTLLVVDATTGQNAVVQARLFDEATSLDGIVLAKLDGNSKGGIAVAVSKETSLPVLFAGLGEAATDLEDFDPVSFADSLFSDD